MRSLIKKLIGSSGVFQSLVTIGGNFFSTGLSAVAMILISRLLGPTSFGQFSVGFAIVQILTRVNDGGLNATILKFAGSTQEKNLIKQTVVSTFKLKFYISLVILGIGLFLTKPLSQHLGFSPTLILASLFFSLATTWYEHLLTTLQALHRFTEAVLTNTIQATVKLAGITIFWVMGATSVYPIYSWYMISPLAAVIAFKLLMPKWFFSKPLKIIKITPPPGLIAMARHSAVGFIAAGLIENVDVLFVQKFLSPYEVGLLSGVSKIAMMLTLVAYSLGNVLYPRVARYTSQSDIWKYLKKSFLVVLMSVVGFGAFIPLGQTLITLTVGKAYLPGNLILLILIASAFLTLATIPFLALFYSYKADWYFSVSGILQLTIVIIGNVFFVPRFGLEAAAWTRFVARLFLFLFTTLLALRIYYHDFHVSNKTAHI